MRGRKPTPTTLRVLRGSRQPKDRAPGDEPQPPALPSDDVPYELKDVLARTEWQRIAPGLIACGQVTMADRTLLLGYCLKFAQWQRLEQEALNTALAEDPARKMKLIRIANQTWDVVKAAASELGLTPTSRTRVARATVAPAPAASKWSGVLP